MRSDLLLIVAISLIVLAVPLAADASEASNTVSANDVNITVFDDSLELNAGSSVSTVLTLTNSDSTYDAVINISCTSDSGDAFTTSVDDSEFDLEKGTSKQIRVTMDADKLSRHGTYSVTVSITVVKMDPSLTTGETSLPLTITVKSSYSSDVTYNKILGIIDPLDEPFGTPLATALMTMGIWIALSMVAYLALHMIAFATFKNDKDTAREISHKTGAMIIIAIVLYGISNSLMVYGADEKIIAFFKNLSSFVYIPIIAYIVWNIYANVIKNLFHRLEEQDKVAGADTSLIPLFRMLGKIVITIVAVSAILRTMGFDLVAIITGAGIAGMAVSLGAQNTLTEFFSGLNLLSTRPFKRGDMVMIDGKDIYQVEKVGLLNSRFKDWKSLEYIIMPNSTVVGSTIINITSKTMAYRMTLDYTVSYDSDIELTKKILVDTAYNHPQVIVDGSQSKPSARLMAFDDSAIRFTLVVFITDFRDYIAVTDELNEDVYRNLCKAGIEIPYNKLDVYIKDDNGDSQ